MYENENRNGYNEYIPKDSWEINPEEQAREYPNGMNHGGGGEGKKEKKKGGFVGKAVKAATLGLLFGSFGAGGFYGIRTVGENLGLFSSTTAISTENGVSAKSGDYARLTNAQNGEVMMAPTTLSTTAVVTDVTQVVDNVMPAIVSIVNEGTTEYFYYTVPTQSSGSGIIIGENDDELLIVSNYHVVAEADKLTVTFNDGSEAEALVKGTDSAMDLAVIAVNIEDLSGETMDSIEIAALGDSESLKVGEPAIAIGNSLGYGQSVTTGVISALDREISTDGGTGTFIQTDAAINPGNSGGALLNISGQVIGINSSKIGGSYVEGMGYAIPISAAKPIIEELMNKTTRTQVAEDQRGYLGIIGATVTSMDVMYYNIPEGVYVQNVYDNSPAEAAGLKQGDYIVGFDGETISSMEQLQRLLMYYAKGTTVEIQVTRPVGNNYQTMTMEITLGDGSSLGVTN